MKKVFITGGTSGIGLASVQLFLNRGYKVGTTARDLSKKNTLMNSQKSHGEQLIVKEADLSQSESVTDLTRFLAEFKPDLLINNAAIYAGTDLIKVSPDDIDQMFAVNLKSVIRLSQACIAEWQNTDKYGHILNVGSTLGNKPAPGTGLYSASKAALVSMTRSIAMEYAPKIRANIIMPGVVATPIHAKVMGADNAQRFQQEMTSAHPLGRIGSPEEFAEILFQLDQTGFEWMTGSVINVDGGISLIS